MEVLLLLCFTAGQVRSRSFLGGLSGRAETLSPSSPQVSCCRGTVWTCAPPATLTLPVTRRRTAQEKFATANTASLETGGLSA